MTGKPQITKAAVMTKIKLARSLGRLDGISAAEKCVPTNWCDDILTGKDGIGKPPYDCRHIEKLLRGVQDKIRALRDAR
jgi:hypothetical protein